MLVENPLYTAVKRIQTRPLRILSLTIVEVISIVIVYFIIWIISSSSELSDSEQFFKHIGRNFAIAMLVGQYIVLVIYGTFSIETRFVRDRISEIINFHRLTPVSPQNLISGYVFGQSSDAIILWCILFVSGIIGVLSGGISFSQYLSSSILVCMCAAFFYLFATWSGLAKPLTLKFGARQTWGFATLLSYIIIGWCGDLSYLSPFPAMWTIIGDGDYFFAPLPTTFVYFFGFSMPTIFYSMLLWITFGFIAFFSSKRKIFSEDSPALSKKEILWLYGALAFIITGRFHGVYTNKLQSIPSLYRVPSIETFLTIGNSFLIFTAFIILLFSIPKRINLRRFFIKLQMKKTIAWNQDDAPSLTLTKFLAMICVAFQIIMDFLITLRISYVQKITIPYADIFLQIVFFSISIFFTIFLIEGFRMRFAKNSDSIPALIIFTWFFVIPFVTLLYVCQKNMKAPYLAVLSPTNFLMPVFLKKFSEETPSFSIIAGFTLLVIATYLSFLFWKNSRKIFEQKLFEIKG